MRLYNFISVFILVIAPSCTKTIDLDLPLKNRRLVVEGIITNEDTAYTVKLSNTTKYSYIYDKARIYYETGATVILSDDAGVTDTLTEKKAGIYTSDSTHIRGIVGRNYKIDIHTKDGRHYQSIPETMLNVTKIDTIYVERNRSDRSKTYPNAYRYRVYIKWQEPKDTDNYYMQITSYYWSNKWQEQNLWNNVFNDYSIDGKSMDIIADQGYVGGDFSLKVNLYALNKNNYDFWRLLYQQRNPNEDRNVDLTVPLVGNILNVNNPSDYAIGYFQVSATSSAEVYIKY